jgi:hypothetical protein
VRYLLNTNTREIHQLDDDGRSMETCNVDSVRRHGNAEMLNEAEVAERLAAGADKCGHCWKEGEE